MINPFSLERVSEAEKEAVGRWSRKRTNKRSRGLSYKALGLGVTGVVTAVLVQTSPAAAYLPTVEDGRAALGVLDDPRCDNLSEGDPRHDCVQALQRAMWVAGYKTAIDGWFGEDTYLKVHMVQEVGPPYILKDGVAGEQTRFLLHGLITDEEALERAGERADSDSAAARDLGCEGVGEVPGVGFALGWLCHNIEGTAY